MRGGGRGGGGGARQRSAPKISLASPFNPDAGGGRRDSDASMCSSRPSSAGGRPIQSAALSDRSSQAAAIRSINAYLSSHSATFSLKPPLPSARDITDCLRFLLSRLDLDGGGSQGPHHLEDDLIAVLKHLGCPVKLNRSALRAPGTPHSWPSLLAAIYWLVQLARYADHQLSSSPPRRPNNDTVLFTTQSYSLFISGEDEAVDALDQEYIRGLEHEAANAAASIDGLAKEAAELEERANRLKSGPSRREELERERDVLVEDCKKFESVVESFKEQVAAMEGKLRDWAKELEAKERESKRICEENNELQKRIDGQAVNPRDVERMRRELQAVERDITEAENGRNAMEEKAWELEAEIAQKLKDLEVTAEQCNQVMKKLKLGNDLQYVLNPQGSSPAEVMGIDYKNILKPSLAALSEDTKKASVSKLEELMALRQQSRENAAMLEDKKGRLAALQAKVDENEAQLSSLKKEIEDHAFRCATEAEKEQEEFTRKENQLSIVEKEAEEFVKSSDQKLQDAIRETDEETQMCNGELLTLIDEVTSYKEFIESMTSGMKTDVIELVKFVGDAKASAVSAKLNALELSHHV